jgi:hypothetical protein
MKRSLESLGIFNIQESSGLGDGVGHKYFVHRHSQNFATPARLFFSTEKT